MSASDHSQTNNPRPNSTFVGFGPKADKPERGPVVRYAPIAAEALQQAASLFDHLVGEREHSYGQLEPKCVGGFEVDD
jgi:hypothetical protein